MSQTERFDPERSWTALEKRLAGETNPRHRQLLESVRDHVRAEIRGEFDNLMATLVDEPQYHFRGLGPDVGPKGREAVATFYQQMIASGGNRFEFDIRRIVVDDDSVVTEGFMRQVSPGSALQAGGVTEVEGQPVEAEAQYLSETTILTVWPAAEDGRLIGEDIWFGSSPGSVVTRL
jgi:limonene-1,2-epoxide hydrolase